MNKQYKTSTKQQKPPVFARPIDDYKQCCSDCKGTFPGSGEREERLECIKGCKDVAKGRSSSD